MHFVQAKGILSKNNGMNIYRGCSHDCIYCDSRSKCYGFTHAFEDIEVKENAPELLEKTFQKKSYIPKTIMLSGNTDCYQPIEQQFEITRKLLQVCLDYRHPVSIITKNALILRDLDILEKMAEKNLISVNGI